MARRKLKGNNRKPHNTRSDQPLMVHVKPRSKSQAKRLSIQLRQPVVFGPSLVWVRCQVCGFKGEITRSAVARHVWRACRDLPGMYS
jgi:hypothetical protein